MKKKLLSFYNMLIIAGCCMSITAFSACSKKIGYGVVNWSIPEHNLTATDVVPILVRSNISKVYIAELNKEKFRSGSSPFVLQNGKHKHISKKQQNTALSMLQ